MDITTYKGCVYPWHCDHMGHMNVMWYVGKFDEATWSLFATLGLTPRYFRDQDRGMAAIEQNLRYRREVHAGDVVEVRSRIVGIGSSSIRIIHEMRDSPTSEIVATSELIGVHLDRTERRAVAFPADLAAHMLTKMETDEPSSADKEPEGVGGN